MWIQVGHRPTKKNRDAPELGRVRREHAIADESRAIANEDSLLADELAHRHAGGNGLRRGLRNLDVLKELHDVRRAEEMRTLCPRRVLEDGTERCWSLRISSMRLSEF